MELSDAKQIATDCIKAMATLDEYHAIELIAHKILEGYERGKEDGYAAGYDVGRDDERYCHIL